MAIEIIPKKKPRRPLWQDFLLYFSIILLMSVVAIYFILGHYTKGLSTTLAGLEKNLKESPQESAREEKVLDYQKKVRDFSILLNSRQISSGFFTKVLEPLCHPEVRFSSFSLDVPKERATLSGEAKSFKVLAEQLLILRDKKNSQLIKNVSLSKVSIGEKGIIKFELEVSFNPDIFK